MPKDSELIFGLREEIVSMVDGLGNFLECSLKYPYTDFLGYEHQEYNCKFWLPITEDFNFNMYKGFMITAEKAFGDIVTCYGPVAISQQKDIQVLDFDVLFSENLLRERFSESKTNRYYKEEMELFKIEFGDKFKV